MPFGTHASTCFVCGKHFLCGDCIVHTCPECHAKSVEIRADCPNGHGMQRATSYIRDLRLACGCSFVSTMEGEWIPEEKKDL